MNSTIRTRFAPSPTGMLHIGGFRTALYSWLLARSSQGKFVLRVEDTDMERKVEGAISYILEGFNWFGLDIDEGPTEQELLQIGEQAQQHYSIGGPYGPYIQSLRRERYKEISDLLVEKGVAFRCDCTPEMLAKEREEQRARKEVPGYSGYCRTRQVSKDVPHVVRFRMPDRPEVEIQDGIRGRISWDSIPLRDPVLMKSDGLPLYHLAVVVDDHDMQISHVLRGEEWIPSTPLHVLLYKSLGWEMPKFCHLPVVLGADGKKLSKRHGATSWSSFREQGYVPEALLNFIARIGWSPGAGDEQEIFELHELVERFSLEHVNASSGIFDYSKLDWMNGTHIRSMPVERFLKLSEPFLKQADIQLERAMLEKAAPLVKERVKTLREVPAMLRFLQDGELERDLDQAIWKGASGSEVAALLGKIQEIFKVIEKWRAAELEASVDGFIEQLGIKKGQAFVALRIACLGKKATPPLFESLELLGKDRVISRLENTRALLEQMGS